MLQHTAALLDVRYALCTSVATAQYEITKCRPLPCTGEVEHQKFLAKACQRVGVVLYVKSVIPYLLIYLTGLLFQYVHQRMRHILGSHYRYKQVGSYI